MILDTTSKIVRVITSSAVATDILASWGDKNGTGVTPGSGITKVVTAATTTVVAAPGASIQRLIKTLSIRNIANTGSQTVEVQLFDGTNAASIFRVVLGPGEFCNYDEEGVWRLFDTSGRVRIANPEVSGITGRPIDFLKVGTAKEAANVWYSYGKDSGSPGAWSPGTPGINGRATDGMSAADAGCLPLWTPTGSLFLTDFTVSSTVQETVMLIDVLWINTGLVATTTTAQAITPVALPARDQEGSTNGLGVEAGILVTGATTNAGAITNTTLNYTNESGVAARTATMASFPATAVAGTIVPFQMAAGDEGVRSPQGITLGTSYAGGAISLILFRRIAMRGCMVSGLASPGQIEAPGLRLWNGSCLVPIANSTVTTAATISGILSVMER